jgi:hypothetical protein
MTQCAVIPWRNERSSAARATQIPERPRQDRCAAAAKPHAAPPAPGGAGAWFSEIETLIPHLKIADRCSLSDKFLVVRGSLRTYTIHLGSSNILMEPNDQYLCIVPGRSAARTTDGKMFLPFEGDERLSVIVSKALMLADDAKITDESITRQIRSP